MPRTPNKGELAAEVWRLLFSFFMLTRPQRDRVLADLELTPNDMRALSALGAPEGRTMRSLADAWGCDASNATWIVDRLEKQGLAERRSVPEDRRVKLVVLTPRGRAVAQEVTKRMFEPPPQLEKLSRADLEALRAALAKLGLSEDPFQSWR